MQSHQNTIKDEEKNTETQGQYYTITLLKYIDFYFYLRAYNVTKAELQLCFEAIYPISSHQFEIS